MADLEALRKAMDAWDRADVDDLLQYLTPDVEGVVPASLSAEPDSYVGHAGIRRYFDLFEETTEDLRFQTEILDDYGDAVVGRMHLTGRGRTSGLAMDLHFFATLSMRGDKVSRIEAHATLEEARESAQRR